VNLASDPASAVNEIENNGTHSVIKMPGGQAASNLRPRNWEGLRGLVPKQFPKVS
jgi:hypothetical protein